MTSDQIGRDADARHDAKRDRGAALDAYWAEVAEIRRLDNETFAAEIDALRRSGTWAEASAVLVVAS